MGLKSMTDEDKLSLNMKIVRYTTGKKAEYGICDDEPVSFISHIMTLLPGDIIATGTTSGIGPMERGDTIEVRIEPIGTLRNYVI